MPATTFDGTTVKQFAFGDLEQEWAGTRKVLERVPEEHFAWKPHEKSYSLAQLAGHVANLPFWTQMTIEADAYDLAQGDNLRKEPATTKDLLTEFDQRVEAARKAFAGMDANELRSGWSLKHGERVFFTMPKSMVLRTFCLNHLVHHRGQLCVYLRMLGVPLPQLYGPTADEPNPIGAG